MSAAGAKKIAVLVVDDSAVVREMLRHILESDVSIRVADTAKNGEDALAALARTKPDVVTMDIHMPGLDGYETTRRIMETEPVPIVIVSATFSAASVAKTFRALEAGAVAMLEKPPGAGTPEQKKYARKLIETVKAMAEVRVVKRWPRARQSVRDAMAEAPLRAAPPQTAPAETTAEIRLVAIGASTGGPPVLQTLLAGLPKPFPVPIVIVQHISSGFVRGLADWLAQTTGHVVRIAHDGAPLKAGEVLIAPDGCHTCVAGARIICRGDAPENGLRPAVARLFRSAAETFGKKAAGVLLTGMGKDGAAELKLMRERGAVTFAQDEESSVIFGMPGAAVQIGAAMHILPPERIASALCELVGAENEKVGAVSSE